MIALLFDSKPKKRRKPRKYNEDYIMLSTWEKLKRDYKVARGGYKTAAYQKLQKHTYRILLKEIQNDY